MLFFMDPEFWARLFGIVIIDLTLAGDNALVIALAVRTLPQRQQFWGRGLLAVLMNRFAWIIWIGGGILGYVASEMILSDRSLARVIEHVAPGRALLPFLPAVGIVALGWWFSAKNGRKGVPGRA